MLYGFGRLAFVLWLCAVGGQVFTLFAFHNAVSQAHTAEIADRLSALASRIAGSAAERSAIGFPLTLQNDLQRQIERVTAGQGGAQLYVLDPRGVVLFGSAQDMVGTRAPGGWFAGGAEQAEVSSSGAPAAWRRVNDDGVMVGFPVVDAFGKESGVVIGRASRQDARVEVLAALRQTATVTVIFLLLVGLLAALGTRLLIDDVQRVVRGRMRLYELLGRRVVAASADPGDAPGLPAEIAASSVGVALDRVLRGLDDAEAEGARIDEIPANPAPLGTPSGTPLTAGGVHG